MQAQFQNVTPAWGPAGSSAALAAAHLRTRAAASRGQGHRTVPPSAWLSAFFRGGVAAACLASRPPGFESSRRPGRASTHNV
jgi:hypothetical protein